VLFRSFTFTAINGCRQTRNGLTTTCGANDCLVP
jgi:hypothetical protein